MKLERSVLEHKISLNFALLCFELAWDLSPHPSFLFLPFGMRMSILGPSHHCVLEVHNSVGFRGSQLERNFTSGGMIPWVSAISDLDDIETRLWTLKSMVAWVKTFGVVEMKWMYVAWKKDMNFENRGRLLWSEYFSLPPNAYIEIAIPNMMVLESGDRKGLLEGD